VSSSRVEQQQLFNVVARLRPGTTLDQGRVEIATIRARIAKTDPNPLSDLAQLRVVPLKEQLIGRAGPALFVVLAASVFVVLIACANAANLLLARASVRYKEIAVRMSVGAGRLRVIRQLLVESLVLVALATAAGLPLAVVAVAGILGINPHAIPRLAETTLDVEVLVAVLGVAALTACIFGLAPAALLWKVDLHDALKNGVRTASPSVRTARTRRLIVAGEVALALVLLIGAGLMLKSAWRMNAYPDGFHPGRILTAKIELFASPYTEPQKMAFVGTLLRGLQTAPGVEAFSISTHGYSLSHALVIEGERLLTPEEFATTPPILVNSTTAALTRVMGFRMVRGRWFADGESATVLNETLARRAFPGRDAIGHRIQVSDEGPWLTVVGIVADLKYSKLDRSAEPEIYVPYARAGDSVWGFDVLILAAGDDPLPLAPIVRQLVSAIDPTQIADRVMTLEQALADSIAPRRLNLLLLGTFAGAAMLLAAIGIYGVMAYSVTQRVHEIGVRMALGARRSDVVGMVVRQGLHITLAGIIVGLLAALALARVMENLLYDVQPTDPMTFAVVTAVLTLTAVVACCVPALKAAFVDPVITLRNE
jgi:putative ABC transport system permease protein